MMDVSTGLPTDDGGKVVWAHDVDDPGPLTRTRLDAVEDVRQLTAAVTSSVVADLDTPIANRLVSDLVRAVIADMHPGQAAQPDQLALEVRRRLDRFARARST